MPSRPATWSPLLPGHIELGRWASQGEDHGGKQRETGSQLLLPAVCVRDVYRQVYSKSFHLVELGSRKREWSLQMKNNESREKEVNHWQNRAVIVELPN